MRMTNKIMQNNSLYNINNNKLLQDKLSTQMSTQKKITRPSDDPVIAIRALRLRTSVSELTQFYEKNAPDAESWLEVTGKALVTVTDVLTDMSREANKADNKEKGVEDLQIIVEQLKSLKDEFYSTGNVDYAGRYVFTGYRTNTTMSFTEEVEEQDEGYPSYEITEQVKIDAFDTINYTDLGKLEGLNENNYKDAAYNGIEEQQITNADIHRLRLSYDDLKSMENTTSTSRQTDANGNTITTVVETDYDKGTETTTVTTTDPNGNPITTDAQGNPVVNPVITVSPVTPNLSISIPGSNVSFDVTKVHAGDNPDPYQTVINDKNAVIFVPETGEVLFGDAVYSNLEAQIKNIKGTDTEIRVTYTKDSWRKGDLRPEHYFACKGTTKDEGGNPKTVNYNQEYLDEGKAKQVIEYDVGYNQKIQVNTTADEVFTHDLDRDIDDLERAMEDLVEINNTKKDLDKILKEYAEKGLGEGDTEYDKVKKQYDAADKAYSYIRENIHNLFGRTITNTQNYLDDTNVAITDNGTRSQRLSLISNRLMDQKTTFQTLQSDNEDADIAEVAIQLTSTELTYEAALMATGKIMQTSLMNYI